MWLSGKVHALHAWDLGFNPQHKNKRIKQKKQNMKGTIYISFFSFSMAGTWGIADAPNVSSTTINENSTKIVLCQLDLGEKKHLR